MIKMIQRIWGRISPWLGAIDKLLDTDERNRTLVTESVTAFLGPPLERQDSISLAERDQTHGWQFVPSIAGGITFMILTVAIDVGEKRVDRINDMNTQDVRRCLRGRGLSCDVSNPILGSIYPVSIHGRYTQLSTARRFVTVW